MSANENNTVYTVQDKAFGAEERKRLADMAKPMAAAPMRYTEYGGVDWGNMWDSFCVLASAGGPAHRATLLAPEAGADPNSEGYKSAEQEIIRGIYLVSGLRAVPAEPGWIAIECPLEGMAEWVAEQAIQENVQFRSSDRYFYVPCGEHWSIVGEIKSVITVVAKTTHYWTDHFRQDIKGILFVEARLGQLRTVIRHIFQRS
jgi:sirohydrochlorin cobaltochelatase